MEILRGVGPGPKRNNILVAIQITIWIQGFRVWILEFFKGLFAITIAVDTQE